MHVLLWCLFVVITGVSKCLMAASDHVQSVGHSLALFAVSEGSVLQRVQENEMD